MSWGLAWEKGSKKVNWSGGGRTKCQKKSRYHLKKKNVIIEQVTGSVF